MLKRTFFVAHSGQSRLLTLTAEQIEKAPPESLKLLNSEFYLVRASSSTPETTATSSDETTSTASSTVLSSSEQQAHLQQLRDYKDRCFGSIGSVFTTR